MSTHVEIRRITRSVRAEDAEGSQPSSSRDLDRGGPSRTAEYHALKTFLATVSGQITVAKDDALILLDDSNAYWWLVRSIDTGGVGFIPGENVEVRDNHKTS